MPLSGIAPAGPPGLYAGVAPHVVERILSGDALSDGVGSGGGHGASVGAVFAAARSEGVGFRVVLDARSLDGLGFSPDATARLQDALVGGWVAIGPDAPVLFADTPRTGWWLVDPLTGRTVDMMDDGRGGGPPVSGEVMILEQSVVRQAVLRAMMRRCLPGLFFGAAAALSLGAMIGSDSLITRVIGLGGFAGSKGAEAYLVLARCAVSGPLPGFGSAQDGAA